MSIEAWQVEFERARAAVGTADEQFQVADQELSRQMAMNPAQPIVKAAHERWLAAKDALDQANADWTVIARVAPVKPSATVSGGA